MQTLYIDNIRGFTKTAVRFSGVTFLLGENSTGKSTLLSILHIINGFSMSFDFEFDSDSHNLGGFDDIVSAQSTNKKSFTIGMARPTVNPHGKTTDSAFFITFGSDEGLPCANKFTFLAESELVSVRIHNKRIYYRIKTLEKNQIHDLYSPTCVSNLAKLHDHDLDESYEELDSPAEIPTAGNAQMLFYAAHMIPTRKDKPGYNPYYYFLNRSQPIWIAPIRTKPKRTYDGTRARFDAEGSHVPYLLRKKLSAKKSSFQKLLLTVGRDGNLFDSLIIKSFGTGEGAPFEVQAGFGSHTYSVAHVGYGVSQVLPIIAEGISQPRNSLFYIQQPEVHLHPRAQASLGELIYTLAAKEEKEFIIETHSDFLIDRFRLSKKRAAEKESARPAASVSSSVLFFTRSSVGNQVQELEIDEAGRYPENQPVEFREFFLKEQLDLLEL
jgi:AAA15 family ATPase/GTPase